MDEIVAIGDMELLEEPLGMVNLKHKKLGSKKY
jgi:hypothetical protein